MPFKSEAQRRFLYARHPKIAERWSKEYKSLGNLPEHVGDKSKSGNMGARKKGKK